MLFKLYDITKPQDARFFKTIKQTESFVTVKEVIKNEEGHFEFVGSSFRRKVFNFGIEISKNKWATKLKR